MDVIKRVKLNEQIKHTLTRWFQKKEERINDNKTMDKNNVWMKASDCFRKNNHPSPQR